MLDIKEIEYWISRYENEADKLDQMPTLSALYSIKDRLQGNARSAPQPQVASYSGTSAPEGETLSQYGDSEFLQVAAGKDPVAVWNIMDELMDTLKVVNQRAYDSVIRKLSRL